MLRYLTAGESHGKHLAGILEGFPAGVGMTEKEASLHLRRRACIAGRSERQRAEACEVKLIGGIAGGLTTGAPVAVLINNKSVFTGLPNPDIPKPGHADLAGMLKYGLEDASIINERASARETAVRTALGAFAWRLLELLGVTITSRVTLLGKADDFSPARMSLRAMKGRLDASPVRCLDKKAAAAMLGCINAARGEGRTLGGAFEVYAGGVPAGLGSHAQGDRRLSAKLAAAMFSINSVKGMEIGGGFCLMRERTENAIDFPELGSGGIIFRTNHAGGLEGGITNGARIIIGCAVKPVPALARPAPSFNFKTGKKAWFKPVRHDITAVPAAAVIAEYMLALELADALLEKFGGDHLREIKQRVDLWRKKTGKIRRLA